MSSVYRKCLMMSDLQSGAEEIEYVLRKDYDALRSRLAEAERDAARYRWLRERMEVGPQRAMSGSTRDAMSVRIGCSFMDSEVLKRRSLNDPDAHENGCKKFDAAIDAFLSRKEGESHE